MVKIGPFSPRVIGDFWHHIQSDRKPEQGDIRFSFVRILHAVATVAASSLLTACGGGPAAINSHGTMQVQEDCSSAASDYPDVDQGTQVVVTNASGTVIGTGQLGGERQQDLPGLGAYGATCNFPFTVQVPGGLARYGITISHRGTIWFSAKQMKDGPGLTLGS